VWFRSAVNVTQMAAIEKMLKEMQGSCDAAARVVAAVRERVEVVARIAEAVIRSLSGGGKVMTCGNGGSAAEALHLAEELVGRFQAKRRALPAICLAADATALTCIANDYEYAEVFARQVEAHGRPGDVLAALSSSGRSESVVRALERARKMGVTTVGLLGPPGSPAEAMCDHVVMLDGHVAARVQEAHLLVIHLLLEQIDRAFSK